MAYSFLLFFYFLHTIQRIGIFYSRFPSSLKHKPSQIIVPVLGSVPVRYSAFRRSLMILKLLLQVRCDVLPLRERVESILLLLAQPPSELYTESIGVYLLVRTPHDVFRDKASKGGTDWLVQVSQHVYRPQFLLLGLPSR